MPARRLSIHVIHPTDPPTHPSSPSPPQPAPPAGNHRYTFLLFEQTKATINPVAPTGRGGFDTRAFATKNGLKAVGGTYFLAQPATAQ